MRLLELLELLLLLLLPPPLPPLLSWLGCQKMLVSRQLELLLPGLRLLPLWYLHYVLQCCGKQPLY